MTTSPMHEPLPFDETTAPSLVSTGELPKPEQVRDVVTEASERYRENREGVVANYIPALASASRGLIEPSDSTSRIRRSRSVICSTRVFSTE